MFQFFSLIAQKQNNVKLGIQTGFLLFSESPENLALLLYVEPKVKVLNKTFFGIRLGVTLNTHKFEIEDTNLFYIDETHDNAILSFVPVLDYYLHEDHFRPYLGLGLGIHLIADVIEINSYSSDDNIEGKVKNRLGVLLRGGFELGKLRVGLEYNLLPKADIEILDKQVVGTVDNNYLGLTIGIIIGSNKK